MSDVPRLRVESGTVVLSGPWTLAEMLPMLALLREGLDKVPRGVRHWDLSAVSRLDSAAAVLLWRACIIPNPFCLYLPVTCMLQSGIWG